MIENQVPRQELAELLDGANAHMSFKEVVADFPPKLLNARAPNIPYTPWHFLEHMRIAQWDILEFIRNPDHVSPSYPEGYRPAPRAHADKGMWEKTIRQFRYDLNALKTMAHDTQLDLFAPIPHAKNYTIFRELLVVADHNAYHIGEFALLRQVLGAWPPDRQYLTGTPEA